MGSGQGGGPQLLCPPATASPPAAPQGAWLAPRGHRATPVAGARKEQSDTTASDVGRRVEAKRGRTLTQQPVQGARSHCPLVPRGGSEPRQDRGQQGEPPPRRHTPGPQALPPPCSPCPAPPQPGLVPAFHGEPHFLGWQHQHVPQATWGDQGCSPQPKRKALSPCPRPHNTETCPGQHLPQGRSTMAVTQLWTPATPGHRGPRPGDQSHPQGLRTVTRGRGFWGAH